MAAFSFFIGNIRNFLPHELVDGGIKENADAANQLRAQFLAGCGFEAQPGADARAEGQQFFAAQLVEQASVAGEDDEIVFYFRDAHESTASWEAAKALAWGYNKVHHFVGGARAWAAAGFPVETED